MNAGFQSIDLFRNTDTDFRSAPASACTPDGLGGDLVDARLRFQFVSAGRESHA